LPQRFDDSAGAGERGVALVLVLWLLTLLAILVVGFAGDGRTQLHLARNQHEAAAAQALADAGVTFAVLGIFDPAPSTQWRADGQVHVVQYGGGELQVSVQDEGGKLDLNVAPLSLLANLFRVQGVANADQLARAVVAGRPAAVSNDGGQGAAAITPAFVAVEDLRRMPGVDWKIYDLIEPFVTVYSGSPQFDPMTAPRVVLLSLPDVQENTIDEFIIERTAPAAIGADFSLVVSHGDVAAAAPLRVFTVRAEATTADGARFVREAVVILTAQAELPYRILSWRSAHRNDGAS
jgi:general secretion pathway protein K